jgi:hypothetical protein
MANWITGSTPTQAAAPVRRAQAPAAAAGQPAASSSNAVGRANRLLAAPSVSGTNSPNALSVIPESWLPMGKSERGFEAKALGVKLLGGKAQLERTNDLVSIKTPQGNFSFKTDPKNPNGVIAVTPKGTFQGTITRNGDSVELKANDGKHGLKMQQKSGYIRFDTDGFGALDAGHLRVKNQ